MTIRLHQMTETSIDLSQNTLFNLAQLGPTKLFSTFMSELKHVEGCVQSNTLHNPTI